MAGLLEVRENRPNSVLNGGLRHSIFNFNPFSNYLVYVYKLCFVRLSREKGNPDTVSAKAGNYTINEIVSSFH